MNRSSLNSSVLGAGSDNGLRPAFVNAVLTLVGGLVPAITHSISVVKELSLSALVVPWRSVGQLVHRVLSLDGTLSAVAAKLRPKVVYLDIGPVGTVVGTVFRPNTLTTSLELVSSADLLVLRKIDSSATATLTLSGAVLGVDIPTSNAPDDRVVTVQQEYRTVDVYAAVYTSGV